MFYLKVCSDSANIATTNVFEYSNERYLNTAEQETAFVRAVYYGMHWHKRLLSDN